MRIEILDRAKRDFLDGFWFYEHQAEGVGRYFVDSVMTDIESLCLYAGVHEKQYGYHRMLAKRFPFAVYYRVEGDVVLVYAVLDCRRHPTWIKKQLTSK